MHTTTFFDISKIFCRRELRCLSPLSPHYILSVVCPLAGFISAVLPVIDWLIDWLIDNWHVEIISTKQPTNQPMVYCCNSNEHVTWIAIIKRTTRQNKIKPDSSKRPLQTHRQQWRQWITSYIFILFSSKYIQDMDYSAIYDLLHFCFDIGNSMAKILPLLSGHWRLDSANLLGNSPGATGPEQWQSWPSQEC